jgi:hypothetical protein
MSPISCSFCTNPNPPEAKFCNQCGSPLGLKPCPACEAVNEAAALECHQCGAALDVPSVEQITSSMQQSIAAEAAGTVSEQASPAAEDAPLHIPESFADRLERDAGLHAFERVEPRIAHSADRDVPEAVTPYVRSTPVRPRGRAWRAPIALAVLAAIAGAGYYAYKRDVPGLDRLAEFALAGRHSEAPASVEYQSQEAPPAATASGAPVANVSSQPTDAAQNAPHSTPAAVAPDAPASESNPASAALVSVQPGAPGQPQIEAASTQPGASSTKPKARPSAALSRNDDEAARQRTDAVSRSRRQTDADAIATQRLIARDLGTAIGPPANAPAAPLDRDAAETQRLIERDLGPFLHRNDRSVRGGTYPAIN